MSDVSTKHFIPVYEQTSRNPLLFLSGMFQTPPENFHNSEFVEIDIERDDEDVSIVVQSLSAGYRHNDSSLYTNKRFKPPIHKESFSLDSADLIKRDAGQNPFESNNFRTSIIVRFLKKAGKVERKIRRAIELQAAQIFQTGKLTLTDENGTALYELDYVPKTSHFFTVGTSWSSGTATIADDIIAACELVRDDSLEDADQAIFGATAFENALKDPDFRERFETRRADQGTISPMEMRGNGGQYRGTIDVGNYKLDVWTYNGKYRDPQTGNKLSYLAGDKVIVRSSTARLDATFGDIPHIGKALGITNSALNVVGLPNRISAANASIDLHTNVWLTENGEDLMGGIGTRPLLIPTAIDSIVCIDTEV